MTYTVSVPRILNKSKRLASRITPECQRMIEAIQATLGFSESSVIEMLVRDYVKRHKITVPPADPPEQQSTTYNDRKSAADVVNEK